MTEWRPRTGRTNLMLVVWQPDGQTKLLPARANLDDVGAETWGLEQEKRGECPELGEVLQKMKTILLRLRF